MTGKGAASNAVLQAAWVLLAAMTTNDMNGAAMTWWTARTRTARYKTYSWWNDIHKPIGDYEAYALNNAYFYAVFGDCGGVERVDEHPTVWVASGAIGPAGSPASPIFVDKSTGATWSKGRKRATDPRWYLKFVTERSNQSLQPVSSLTTF
jgi:hypothetical protein